MRCAIIFQCAFLYGEKWIALADEAYGNQPDLKNKLWKAYQAGMILIGLGYLFKPFLANSRSLLLKSIFF
jgi:hypothetical protein